MVSDNCRKMRACKLILAFVSYLGVAARYVRVAARQSEALSPQLKLGMCVLFLRRA